MDLRHLRHFVAVAEERHFGRAAERLGIEQSPLSRSIRQLEAQLRTTLLERTSRGSRLTPAGTALLPEARAILAQVARLKTVGIATPEPRGSRLRLGVCDAVATTRLSVCLSALRQQHPELAVAVVPLGPTESADAVTSGTVDASFALSPLKSGAITHSHCWPERFVVAVTSKSNSSPDARIPVTTLLAAKEVVVTDAWAQPAGHWLRALATATGGNVPPVRSIPSYVGLLTAIVMDFSIGLLPSGFEDTLFRTGVATRAVGGRNPRFPVVLLYRDGNQHPGIEALRTVIEGRPWRFGMTTSVCEPAETPDRSP